MGHMIPVSWVRSIHQNNAISLNISVEPSQVLWHLKSTKPHSPSCFAQRTVHTHHSRSTAHDSMAKKVNVSEYSYLGQQVYSCRFDRGLGCSRRPSCPYRSLHAQGYHVPFVRWECWPLGSATASPSPSQRSPSIAPDVNSNPRTRYL